MKALSEGYWFVSSLCSIVLKSEEWYMSDIEEKARKRRTHRSLDDVIVIFDFIAIDRLQKSPCLWMLL
jgi:hypothetical protein